MSKVVALVCLVGLVLAGPAQAKGPDRATLTGPGLETPLLFSGYGSDGKAPLGVLTQRTVEFQQIHISASSASPSSRASGAPDTGRALR